MEVYTGVEDDVLNKTIRKFYKLMMRECEDISEAHESISVSTAMMAIIVGATSRLLEGNIRDEGLDPILKELDKAIRVNYHFLRKQTKEFMAERTK